MFRIKSEDFHFSPSAPVLEHVPFGMSMMSDHLRSIIVVTDTEASLGSSESGGPGTLHVKLG